MSIFFFFFFFSKWRKDLVIPCSPLPICRRKFFAPQNLSSLPLICWSLTNWLTLENSQLSLLPQTTSFLVDSCCSPGQPSRLTRKFIYFPSCSCSWTWFINISSIILNANSHEENREKKYIYRFSTYLSIDLLASFWKQLIWRKFF